MGGLLPIIQGHPLPTAVPAIFHDRRWPVGSCVPGRLLLLNRSSLEHTAAWSPCESGKQRSSSRVSATNPERNWRHKQLAAWPKTGHQAVYDKCLGVSMVCV